MPKNVFVILDEMAGRVRELRQALTQPAPLPDVPVPPTPPGYDLKRILAKVEREVIERAMRRVDGNQVQGARLLGISRGGLIAKMKQYRIEDFRYLRQRK